MLKLRHIFDLTDPMMAGKDVLDIGSIGHQFEQRQDEGTFYLEHFQSIANARGIDILEDDVARAKRAGFNVVVGNAESYVDGHLYDVIFAGELVEHVSNAGAFLDCCHRNLKEDGRVILTTPNAFSVTTLSRVILKLTNEPPVNVEHACYYTPQTLRQLVTRHGFEIEQLFFQDYDFGKLRDRYHLSKRLGIRAIERFTSLFPQFCQSFGVVLKKADAEAVRLAA